MQQASPQAGNTQTGDTTVNRAIDRYNLAMELRRVRDTLQELEAVRNPPQNLLVYYKARLSELRSILQIFETAS